MSLLRPLLVLGLASFVAVGSSRAQLLDYSATARATSAQNLSRTSNVPDQKDAMVYDGSVTGQWHRQIARNLTFVAEGEVGGEWVPKFDGLDTYQFGGQLALSYKFGLGSLAPVFRTGIEAMRYEVREDARSGWKTAVTASLSKRFTETWRASINGEWLDYAAQGHPFDVRNHRIGIDTTWDVTDIWQVNAGYSRLSGQLTANADGDAWERATSGALGAAVADYYESIPSAPSTVFGDDWIAYRIDCDADIWWLEISAALGPNTSLPLRYEAVKVSSHVGIGYDSEFWSLSIVHRF
jgi:hypothetical protein